MEKIQIITEIVRKMDAKTTVEFREEGILFKKHFYLDELLGLCETFKELCDGKETTNENSRFNAVAVIKSLPKISTFNSICIECELYKWYINNNPDIPF